MADCYKEGCPWRVKDYSSHRSCQCVACPNRYDGTTCYASDHTEGYRLGKEDAEAGGKDNNVPANKPLNCTGCRYLDEQCAPCASCVRAQKYADYYRCEAPTIAPQDEPLTIEQLRQMDGQPVWIVDVGNRKWYGPSWAIVDREANLVRTVKNWNAVFFEKYGERWIAYRRPPERQEDL